MSTKHSQNKNFITRFFFLTRKLHVLNFSSVLQGEDNIIQHAPLKEILMLYIIMQIKNYLISYWKTAEFKNVSRKEGKFLSSYERFGRHWQVYSLKVHLSKVYIVILLYHSKLYNKKYRKKIRRVVSVTFDNQKQNIFVYIAH